MPDIPNTLKAMIGNTFINASYGEIGNRLDFTECFVTHMSIAANIVKDRMVMDLTIEARKHLQNARQYSYNEETRMKAIDELSGVLISLGKYVFDGGYGTIDIKTFNPRSTETPK